MVAASKVADLAQNKVVVAGALLLTVTTALDVVRRWRRKGQQPPYPPGSWPFLGHFVTVMRYCWDNSSWALAKWGLELQRSQGFKTHGLNFCGTYIICLSDADLVQEVFEGDPHRFTKNFNDLPLGGDLLEYSFKDGLFTVNTDNPAWQVAHRILISPFSVRGVRGIMPMMCDQADLLIKAMKRDVGYGGTTYIDTWVVKMAFETIAVCGLGTSFGCFENAEINPFVKHLNEVVESLDVLGRWPPFLRRIFCRQRLQSYIDSSASVRRTCMEILQRRKSEEHKESHKDLLDRMLSDADPKTGQKMSEESVVDNLLTFLFAGQDSTAAAMASCLCYLCANPTCKERLLREIDEVVGKDQLSWEHLNELQYLDWCIKETLRLMPPGSLLLRTSTREQVLGGWYVPAKVPIIVNILALHYSEDLWGADVNEFKPERWERGLPHKFAFMPFAHGPRACIGREFTLMEQKVTMVKFFQNFDVERVPGDKAGYTVLKPDGRSPPFLNFDTPLHLHEERVFTLRYCQCPSGRRRPPSWACATTSSCYHGALCRPEPN
ncbi:unnamed protein product [Durusdinium trenchii]|uniref:Cytochrome P450 n=1 Tax=Durusdinium trenchii TaxID=1381693 RepID=A0ABP0IKE6_9DINO